MKSFGKIQEGNLGGLKRDEMCSSRGEVIALRKDQPSKGKTKTDDNPVSVNTNEWLRLEQWTCSGYIACWSPDCEETM
jgi:hypothetical protein